MSNIYTIYKITNQINNKSYIGFTSYSPQHRWSSHKVAANRGGKSLFQAAIVKHGPENFIVETIYQSLDEDHTLNTMEPHFINEYNTFHGDGYNSTAGGGSKRKGKKADPEFVKLQQQLGKLIFAHMIHNGAMPHPDAELLNFLRTYIYIGK